MRYEAWRWFVRGTGFALGVALAIGAVAAIVLGAKVVILVFVALLLASGLGPFVRQVSRHSVLGRGATLLLVYIAFFAAVTILALLIVPTAINELSELGSRLAPILADARRWAGTLEPRFVGLGVAGIVDTIQRIVAGPTAAPPQPDQLIALGVTFADIVVTVISLLVLVYFWLTERARLQRFALALLPAERRAGARAMWNEIEVRLGAWVRGELVLMGSVGTAMTIAYLVIGLDAALLLGVIVGLAEVIPLVGPALGAAPALVVAASTGHIDTVVFVAVAYIVIQLVESNVLVPVVMRNTVGIPPFLVFVTVLAGAAIAGVVGVVVAVPLAAAIIVILERLQARRLPVPLQPAGSSGETIETIEQEPKPEPAART